MTIVPVVVKMNVVSVAIFVFLGLSYVSGQVPRLGKCPDVTTMKPFAVGEYLGSWYEITKFFFVTEIDLKCVGAKYTDLGGGKVEVYNTGININTGEMSNATGSARVPDPVNFPAKLKVKFSESAPEADYWVVDTDFKTYSLVYSCVNILDVGNLEFSWILSRDRTLDQTTVDMLKDKIKAFGVDPSNYSPVDQTGCE